MNAWALSWAEMVTLKGSRIQSNAPAFVREIPNLLAGKLKTIVEDVFSPKSIIYSTIACPSSIVTELSDLTHYDSLSQVGTSIWERR